MRDRTDQPPGQPSPSIWFPANAGICEACNGMLAGGTHTCGQESR